MPRSRGPVDSQQLLGLLTRWGSRPFAVAALVSPLFSHAPPAGALAGRRGCPSAGSPPAGEARAGWRRRVWRSRRPAPGAVAGDAALDIDRGARAGTQRGRGCGGEWRSTRSPRGFRWGRSRTPARPRHGPGMGGRPPGRIGLEKRRAAYGLRYRPRASRPDGASLRVS